jgi:uncharacterized membrane protein
MVAVKRSWPHLSGTLVILSLVSLGFLFAGALRGGIFNYWYMVWNLFLAWLPLLLVLWLLRTLRHKRWSSWPGIALSVLWLGFLPNAFYMVTDYIHLADTASIDLVYDAAMLTAFVVTGLVLGYISLYLFHIELKKRLPAVTAARVVAFILFLCSVAIYLGRDLRWNTWDLFLDPAGILYDISDRIINPRTHPEIFVTTLTFFILLGAFYLLTWNIIQAVSATHTASGGKTDKHS